MHQPLAEQARRQQQAQFNLEQMAQRQPQNKAKGGKAEPKKTVKAYKMFRVHPKHPGKLFPLFVDADTPVEMGKWIDAKEGEMRNGKVKSKIGDLAYRPGWHAGDLPIATHIGDKDEEQKAEIKRIKAQRKKVLDRLGNDKTGKRVAKAKHPFPEWVNAPRLRNHRHIWAEVEMPDDVDWHSEATKRGMNEKGKFVPSQAHITDQIPKGGHYRYKTNPNMTGNWIIGGSMKVNRILPDEEVESINKAAGTADLPRAKPMKQADYGFSTGGMVCPEEWLAEELVNHKAKGGEVKHRNPFDYQNKKHTHDVAGHLLKHGELNTGEHARQHLSEMLATGNWKYLEDPRMQAAIRDAGHDAYFVQEKTGKQMHPINKAEGGLTRSPSLAQMRMELAQKGTNVDLKNVGVNEAPNMAPKHYFPADGSSDGAPSPGGVSTSSGMAIGGIDTNRMQAGQQLMPQLQQQQQPPAQQQGQGQPPQPGQPQGQAPQGPTPPMGNMLSMTPQGQAMSAMGGGQQPQPPKMAKGGSAKSVDEMKAEMASKKPEADAKRVTIHAEGPGGVKGLVVPRHTLEGNAKSGAVGLHEMNEARAKVYGAHHREPLTIGKIDETHKKTLAEHFAKPVEEQIEAEKAALARLREAKHLGKDADTLDESEKLDTVRHEHDEEGRTHVGYASKGVAGHALYTSGAGKDTKYHVINTCPGQTEGCGGGKDAQGIVDTKKGTCFAPNAESQYPGAATRRAAHEQAKHDPAMTNDWILAHTHSLRNAANRADKRNQRTLFRPNVVDETDVSSRHVIRHLNEQRKAEGKPGIIANSYGKTNELHDPENGYHVTHSNVGPKVKKGQEVSENIKRDKARVRNTILAEDNKGDFKNEQGNLTPPKGSYMVTDVKRGSPLSKRMQEHITHAKYWSAGRPESELSEEEKAEGPEGHFGPSGRRTKEEHAHYGHRTLDGLRYDYQRQHILHPRLVQVGTNKDGTPHMIPTDSRFKDTDFLPKNRYKTKNGKEAGHILMTTPTESTSNLGHQTSFTHHVNEKHIEHAMKNNGEYEIDRPEDQAKAKGKEYQAPQAIKFYAEGGNVGGRHRGFGHDEFHAFPEQNIMAQRHLAMRRGDEEAQEKYHSNKKAVMIHKSPMAMQLEMLKHKKAK